MFLLMVSPQTAWAVGNGNPIVICTGLLLICCFDVEDGHRWFRAVLFLPWQCCSSPRSLYQSRCRFCSRQEDGWRTLLRACVPGAPGSTPIGRLVGKAILRHRRGLPSCMRNLVLGSSVGNTMSLTERSWPFDPRLNLSYLLGYWIASPKLKRSAHCFVGRRLRLCAPAGFTNSLAAVSSSQQRWLLALAATSAFTLLPVYHRSYDSILLVLAVPWALASIAARKYRFAAWTTLFLVSSTCVIWARHLPRRWVGEEGVEQAASLMGFFTHRLHALLAFALAVILLAAFSQESRHMQLVD